MIQRCSVCRVIYGHKAPFLDTTETWGVCKDCHAQFLERILKESGKMPTRGKTLEARREIEQVATPKISRL